MVIKRSSTFQLSYPKDDVDYFVDLEQSLMNKLKIKTRSDLHTKALKHLHYSVTTNNLFV